MELTFASYNIHKAVGLDRRRDPDRILTILYEIDADVIALQEADRRFGRRESVLPLSAIDDLGHYRAVPLNHRPDSIGWHGNALLVRRHFTIADAGVVPLPTLEPRGAVRADLELPVLFGHRLFDGALGGEKVLAFGLAGLLGLACRRPDLPHEAGGAVDRLLVDLVRHAGQRLDQLVGASGQRRILLGQPIH